MYKNLIKFKYWIILFLIFLILRVPSLFEPYWYGDEGIYLVLGQAIRKGVVLYSHIHDNKPPTLYYLAAFAQTVFGFRLLLLFFMVPTIYFFHRLSQFFLSEKGSKIATFIFLILTSIPLFEGNIANAEVFMLLPTIVGVLFLIKSKPKFQNLIFSGLLLGIAFTIKIPVVIEFIFLCLWLFIDNLDSFKKTFFKIKNIFIFGLAFLLPITFWAVYYYLQGAFIPFLNASLFQNFGYLSSWSTGTQTSSVSSGGVITRSLILLIFWALIFLLKNREIISKKFSFLLFWFSATIFGSLLSGRPYPHYLIQALPPLTLIIVECLDFKERKKQILSVCSLLLFTLIIFKFQFYFYPVFSYYSNFYSHIIGIKSTTDYRNYFGSQINDIYEISDFIKTNTNSTDKIFIWGDQPYIYALSDRLPSSKYTVSYHIIDFNGYQSTMDKIEANLPKFIVYYQMPGRSFYNLDNFINNYYFTVKVIGNATIFKLR
jgi:4-amino-4-deoxy-L-arabinose transferase-like glycosyltransferase